MRNEEIAFDDSAFFHESIIDKEAMRLYRANRPEAKAALYLSQLNPLKKAKIIN